jgi:hypothetical protein
VLVPPRDAHPYRNFVEETTDETLELTWLADEETPEAPLPE